MDIPQLKLLAERVRDALVMQNHAIGYSQSLDLIAALPGLRNWPEVQAFPGHVARCEVSTTTVERLSRRLLKRGVEMDIAALLRVLEPGVASSRDDDLELWPGGPAAGVYVTTSESAIHALTAAWDDATDGAAFYYEGIGLRGMDAIRLGEDGLWSSGLSRISSGTLIVVGPLVLTQEEWSNNSEKLQQACALAAFDHLRIAVLVDTPAPENLYSDVVLLTGPDSAETGDLQHELRGDVSEAGRLVERNPFLSNRPEVVLAALRPVPRLPTKLESVLTDALSRRRYGLLIFGSREHKPERALMVEALLALTVDAGPVARILPDDRVDYDGEPPLSAAFVGVPVLPSIESAHAHGYRRMVIEKVWGVTEEVLRYAGDTCFILSAFGLEAGDALSHTTGTRLPPAAALPHLIAAVGMAVFDTKAGKQIAADVYAGSSPDQQLDDDEAVLDHIGKSRCLRWQDELGALLDAKLVTATQVRRELKNVPAVAEFLSRRKNGVPGPSNLTEVA